MDVTTTITATVSGDAEVIPVRWEPCADVRPDGIAAPLCGVCGWPVDDHRFDGAPRPPARAA